MDRYPSQKKALGIIQDNIKVIHHVPTRYVAIRHYLEGTAVKGTLLKTLGFLKRKYSQTDKANHIIIEHQRYEFFLCNNKLAFGIRHSSGTGTANRHMNFLCAMGLFTKIKQDHNSRIKPNINFKEKNPHKRDINVFSFRLLTKEELDRIEARSNRLRAAGITPGNISSNKLLCSVPHLDDIALEVFPNNKKTAHVLKKQEYQELLACMELLIDCQGYATRQQLKDNLIFPDSEINRLFTIFKQSLEQRYSYHRPTKDEQQRYQLITQSFIYTTKENE